MEPRHLEHWRDDALTLADEADCSELRDVFLAIVEVLNRAMDGDQRVAESVPILLDVIAALR